jgi:hypothetical protein
MKAAAVVLLCTIDPQPYCRYAPRETRRNRTPASNSTGKTPVTALLRSVFATREPNGST